MQGAYDPPARFQWIVAAVLVLVLVGVPLYLWRRPRSVADPVGAESAQADGGAPDAASTVVVTEVDAGPSGVTLGDARILECHDPGTKHTPAEQCDHLPAFEKSLADAIQQGKDCVVPPASGTITYVADVSFSHKRTPIQISLPRDLRSIKSTKIVQGCSAAVKHTLSAVALDAVPHEHARYKIAVAATYPIPK
jgi:hypothetical protein